MDKFMKGEDLMNIRANSYDLVLNGYELSSGSIRIHKSDMQKKVFELLKIDEAHSSEIWSHARGFQVWRPAARRIRPGHRPHRDDHDERAEHPRGHPVPEDRRREGSHDGFAVRSGQEAVG